MQTYLKSLSSAATFVGLLCLAGCNPQPSRTQMTIPADSLPNDWESVFKKMGVIELQTLTTGSVAVDVNRMLNLETASALELYQRTGAATEQLDLSVFVHWISHPQQGDFLIDTGFDSSFTKKSWGSLSGLFANKSITGQQTGQDIGSQIKRLGIKPIGVFFTHVHVDHTAGVPELPTITQYVVGKNEEYIDIPLIYSHRHLANVSTLSEIDFDTAKSMPILGKTVDVWGDNSLLAIDTRGHSKGHMSFLINTTEGWVLLTGDASHTRWGFENSIEPGTADDRELTKQSLDKLVVFSKKYPFIRVVFGHEF